MPGQGVAVNLFILKQCYIIYIKAIVSILKQVGDDDGHI